MAVRLKSSAAASLVVPRIIVCGLGGAAAAWALYVFPIFWVQSGVENTAQHIIAGDSFKRGALTALDATLISIKDEKWDRPSALGSVAVIRLRLLENAVAEGDQKTIDARAAILQPAIRKSLANSPADPFLWMALFRVENGLNGFARDHLNYLRMSYLTGPSEGWIAVKRNPLALTNFSRLSPDLATDAIHEFSGIVNSLFIDEAADILVGPGWPIRDKLLPSLKDVALLNRQAFAKTVYRLGFDVSVPGVVLPEARPWD